LTDFEQIRARLAARVGGEQAFASSFSDRTMRDLDARAKRELDDGANLAIETVERVTAALAKAGHDPATFDQAAFLDRFVNAWAAYQHAGARTANWMVTGPARFPVERNRKRMDTEHRRWQELDALCKAAPHRALKDAERQRKQQLGPAGVVDAELADLKARLEKREAAQRHMKIVNEVIRRHKLGEGDGATLSALLTDRGIDVNPNRAGMILRPPYQGARGGYERFQLSNNLAEIKRLKGRIQDVERKAAAIESEPAREQEINGVRIVEDPIDDRLRLLFDGKPAPEIIAALKSRGFRWSPRNSAWQRQLTGNARMAAAAIVERMAA
jgi:hypothetical protein